eukprot:scaffold348314_cov32-Prasinocladus_malaysianus.AAC.1
MPWETWQWHGSHCTDFRLSFARRRPPSASRDRRQSWSPSASAYSQVKPSSRSAMGREAEPEADVSSSSRRPPAEYGHNLHAPRRQDHPPPPASSRPRPAQSAVAAESPGLTWRDLAAEGRQPPAAPQSRPAAVPPPAPPKLSEEALQQISDLRAALTDLFRKSAKLCERDGMDRGLPTIDSVTQNVANI